ncbi:hypothetical protein EB118_02795 [bacterium]|nr:hypothetical protein [bacterium]
MEYKFKTRFCPALETGSILFPRTNYGLPPCSDCLTTGVPIPSNIQVTPQQKSVLITFNFNYPMLGSDYFLIISTNVITSSNATIRFQENSSYSFGGLVSGQTYTFTIIPVIDNIRYASATSLPSTNY